MLRRHYTKVVLVGNHDGAVLMCHIDAKGLPKAQDVQSVLMRNTNLSSAFLLVSQYLSMRCLLKDHFWYGIIKVKQTVDSASVKVPVWQCKATDLPSVNFRHLRILHAHKLKLAVRF